MGIIVSAAMIAPNYHIRLIFIGEIKLKYIALVMILISVFGVTSTNAGGEFAHLGGALVGYFYAIAYRRGHDISTPINKLIDRIVNLFKRKPKMKVYRTKTTVKSDAEYNQDKAENNAAIDRILDKIKRSGYESLTKEEKKQLFDRSQKV
jgi:CBS domain containing-hemolysin-like protein